MAVLREIPVPDPTVVESARLRLAARYGGKAGQPPVQLPATPVAADVRAVIALIMAADASTGQAGTTEVTALDIAAGLVVLCDLRLYLGRLEADLLDRARPAGLIIDAIAAIMGIPAAAVQRRHAALRARRDSR